MLAGQTMSGLTLKADALIAADDSGGVDLAYCDEDLAVAIFIRWHRAERLRLAREDAATARRARLRLVHPTRLEEPPNA